MAAPQFTRRPPVPPAHLRAELAAIELADRELTRTLRGRGSAGLEAAVLVVRDVLLRPRTAEERAAEARYEREVDDYNTAVRAHNAAIRNRAQARVNASQVAAVRNAACPRCFATHAGEC